MPHIFLLLLIAISLVSCQQKTEVDQLVYGQFHNYKTTEGEQFEALAIKNGKILKTGTKQLIDDAYSGPVLDLSDKHIYPAFHDAHCHFKGYGLNLFNVNLLGTQSFDECIQRCRDFNAENNLGFVTGRGWDHEDWEGKAYPNNDLLSIAFPDIPVVIRRIDGHAAIANKKAMEMAGFTVKTMIPGGKLLEENGELTGLLIDNAVDTILALAIPQPDKEIIQKALLAAQDSCLKYGLAYVTDAGLDWSDLEIIKELQDAGKLKMRMNVMLSAFDENLKNLHRAEEFSSNYLKAKSIKFYSDGSLGSRGACLLHPYSDRADWTGFLLNTRERLEEVADSAIKYDFQVCTHAIGDSGNRNALQVYHEKLDEVEDARWRIEHAQVVHPDDRSLFIPGKVIASVQPTHATSDMFWAEKRLGPDRIDHAYAYQSLRNESEYLPLGTDFPVEGIMPRLTIYAAVVREDYNGHPEGGFLKSEGLSIQQALKGFTYDGAYAAKMDAVWGSLNAGKLADFIVFSKPIEEMTKEELAALEMESIFLEGKKIKPLNRIE